MSKENNKFPVLLSYHGGSREKGFPTHVKWSELSESQAQKNHSQSLGRLAERGGLSPSEIVGNIKGIGWCDLGTITENQTQEALREIAANE